jgi:hypothetical protein
MIDPPIHRKLWYFNGDDRVVVEQDFLLSEPRSLVILGEAGMGKSTLLNQLREIEGFSLCSARKLTLVPDAGKLLGESRTLVIDALDEISSQLEGAAVDRVLRRLLELDSPRFILSCRVADWRSATALQSIAEFYDPAPLELHLEPLDRNDALALLSSSISEAKAEELINHLEKGVLSGLWRNPQTLKLVASVAEKGALPHSKGDLFSKATDILRSEHCPSRAATALADFSGLEVLDCAGAAFAALIINDKEAVSRQVDVAPFDIAVAELAALPGAARLGDVFDSRLFEARGKNRLAYGHRAIGEFLGARWLATQANTSRKRRRVLELLNNPVLVPASLRGIHAWLAWHSPTLAEAVIESDPMGVIEYGDADTLTLPHAKLLLRALIKLSAGNPNFRSWTDYRANSLAQPGMEEEVRQVLRDPRFEFGLRLLILEVLKDSALVSMLRDEFLSLLLDQGLPFAIRSEAGDRLVESRHEADWPTLILNLISESTDDGARLASQLVNSLGYAMFDDALLIAMVEAQLGRASYAVGTCDLLLRNFPDERLDALLGNLATLANSMGGRYERRSNDEITDFAFAMIARRLKGPSPSAETLWTWLEPFEPSIGVDRETRAAVSAALRAKDDLRHAVQRHVLFGATSEPDFVQRSWDLLWPLEGLRLDEDDVVWLLTQIQQHDPRWRELVLLVPHDSAAGEKVRSAAERFTMNDDAARDWLSALSIPCVPMWQLEENRRNLERAAKRDQAWNEDRRNFSANIDAMLAGEYGVIIGPAIAYLKLHNDIGRAAKDGPCRIEEWLGADLRNAALVGFEAFLTSDSPSPTAQDIAISRANGRSLLAGYIIVAALAERVRTGRSLDGVPNDRIMAGYFQLFGYRITEHAGIVHLDEVLATQLRARGQWELVQRLFIEPQLAAGTQHVLGTKELLRTERDSDLSECLAREWLGRFPEMSEEAELDLVDRLIGSELGRATLRAFLPQRYSIKTTAERRRAWDAIGIILDFEATRERLEATGFADPALLFSLRSRVGDGNSRLSTSLLSSTQVAWLFRTFRPLFPFAQRPSDVTWGTTNSWDATCYLLSLVHRLARERDRFSEAVLLEFRDAPPDGYTDHLRNALAEHARLRVEIEWTAPHLKTLLAAVTDQAPTTAAQLQAVLVEELQRVQRKVRGSNVDWYRDFFSDDGIPKEEEACRDVVLKMLGDLPFGVQASPEGHLADDKRCDIECTLPGIMVPIEIKGQWHRNLWDGADSQLDRLYTKDWRSGKGIYLVLWFGTDSTKRLAKPPAGRRSPKSAEELRDALVVGNVSARQGNTEIVVLDLTRPVN